MTVSEIGSARRRSVTFEVDGTDCDAWFFTPPEGLADASPFATSAGVPVVVMAHGFCGTKDSGLEPFAARLAAAGLAVFAFDFRGFGLSGGAVRQRVSMSGQIADFHAAVNAAKGQPGVDADRVVLWGLSQSGGHVLALGAERDDVAAVISVVPLVSGLAAGRHHYPQVGAVSMLRSAMSGAASTIATRLGGSPTMIPVVGRPGTRAALTSEGYYESYLAISGPSWRNEVDASIATELGSYRADRHAGKITGPVLVQIADLDRGAPPHAAAKAAFKARAEVRHYPCDHFGVFEEIDEETFGRVVDHQIGFLTRHLARENHSVDQGSPA
ncbi:alpha/beta hydrolase [Gordonia sp. NPDC003429]